MAAPDQYDFIMIGAGQSGDPLARACARAGKRTALIERDAVGGTCVNYGCTPTKTMVASGRTAYVAGRAPLLGVHSSTVSVDMSRVRQRKRDIVEEFRSGTETRLRAIENLDLIYGEARFASARSVIVAAKSGEERELTASQAIVVNTGQRPIVPDLPGLDTVPYLDSTSIMELDRVPEHLVVLGGGYIAVEFGQLMRRLGSRVTILQRAKQLLGREDDDIAAAVKDILIEDGIDVLIEATSKKVEPAAGGVALTVSGPAGERRIEGSHLLVAVGRVSNTEALALERAGIALDGRGNIAANDRLETSAPGVFAMGDVKGGPAFTHISYDDYRILSRRLLEGDEHASIAGRLVPYTVFMDPQLGRVGMTEAEARAKGLNIKVATMPMSYVARALESEEKRGMVKAVVDTDTGRILGVAVLGYEGGELMAVAQVAMMGKLPYTALRDGIFAHPTSSELYNNLFASL